VDILDPPPSSTRSEQGRVREYRYPCAQAIAWIITHAAVGIAMAAATFRFMQATAKKAMRRVLGIRHKLRGGQNETLVPPTAVAGGDKGSVFEFEASDNNNSG
jgi:hypothetical protein